jgi:hypothetical protein
MTIRRSLIVAASVLGLAMGTPVAAKEHRAVAGDTTRERTTNYLQMKKIVPAADPTAKMTRMQFLTILVKLTYSKDLDDGCFKDLAPYTKPTYTKLFSDVSRDDRNAIAVCVALLNGVVRGRNDGALHGEAAIRSAEAAYMMYKAYALGPIGRPNPEGAPWYSHFLLDASYRGGFSKKMMDPRHELTNDEAEMLYQLRNYGENLQNPKIKVTVKPRMRLLGNVPATDLSQKPIVVNVRGRTLIVPRPQRRN